MSDVISDNNQILLIFQFWRGGEGIGGGSKNLDNVQSFPEEEISVGEYINLFVLFI